MKKIATPTFNAQNFLRLTHKSHIPTDEIVYLESEVNYTNVYTSDNKKYLSSFTLKKLESRIAESAFVRINRGCLVNPKHITHITGMKRNAQARLSNGSELIISRRKFDIIKNIFDKDMLSLDI